RPIVPTSTRRAPRTSSWSTPSRLPTTSAVPTGRRSSPSTDPPRRSDQVLRALQVGVAATMLTLGAGCSSPEVDVPDRLLQPDDLPAVEKVDVVDRSAVSRVGCADLALEYNLTITDGADATAVYTLRSGDEVRSAVQGTRLTATGIDHTLEELR